MLSLNFHLHARRNSPVRVKTTSFSMPRKHVPNPARPDTHVCYEIVVPKPAEMRRLFERICRDKGSRISAIDWLRQTATGEPCSLSTIQRRTAAIEILAEVLVRQHRLHADISELTRQDIDRFQTRMSERGFTLSSIRACKSALGALMEVAVRQNRALINVVRKSANVL